MTRRPTISMKATKAATLPSVMRERQRDRRRSPRRRVALQDAGQRRQQHQRQHHREVLDDQPADRDAAALGLDQPPLLQRAQQHDGAGDRQREAEHEAARRSASRAAQASPMPSSVATAICTTAPGIAIARTDSRSFEREMQADAEHQQDDADLGQLVGELLVGDEAGRERPDQHAGQQIADQRRNRAAAAPARRRRRRARGRRRWWRSAACGEPLPAF